MLKRLVQRYQAQARDPLRRDAVLSALFSTDPSKSDGAAPEPSDRARSSQGASSSKSEQPVSRLFAKLKEQGGSKKPAPANRSPRAPGPSGQGQNRPRQPYRPPSRGGGPRPGPRPQSPRGDGGQQRSQTPRQRPEGFAAGGFQDELDERDPFAYQRQRDRRPPRDGGQRRPYPQQQQQQRPYPQGQRPGGPRPRSGPPSRRPRRPQNRPFIRPGATQNEVAYAEDSQKYRLAQGEPMALLDPASLNRIRSTADMPMYPQHYEMEAMRAHLMDIDPEVNINWGMPVRRPLPSAEEAAESSKQQLMEGSGASSEEDWQAIKAGAVRNIELLRWQLRIRDVKAEEAILEGWRDKVAKDHPLYSHVEMTVHQLNRNPWWTFEQKEQMVSSLVKQFGR